MGIKYIAFGCPKNSTFLKSGQICRVDWNWSGDHFLQEWLFFFAMLSFWDMIDLVFFFAGLYRNMNKIYIYFLSGWLRPLHRSCPGAGRFKIDIKSEQVSVSGIFCKAGLCCFPVKHSSPRLLLSNVKYKTDNNAKTKNRTKNSWIQKVRSEQCASFIFSLIVGFFTGLWE